ncbi:hypothetical protein [Halalkalicoccus salilacus]|uniref:hypothetical protein n=1 Tax=Halalkalicoccus salilacus TaxID=3117459 RepID=UPI0038D44109
MGRAPEVGDRIEENDYLLDVDHVDGARISTVVIREADDDGQETDPNTDPSD